MRELYQTRQTLIQRLKVDCDEQSWEEFLRIYQPYVYTVIRNMNISENDADDISQQVMFKVWKNIGDIQTGSNWRFSGWLSRITKNCVKDFIRKRVRDAERVEKVRQDETHSYLNGIRLPDIDRIAEKEWGIHVFNLAMERVEGLFTGKAMKVFRFSLEGMEVSEIAARMNLKENSVYRLKNRVKERVAQEIEVLREELE